MQCEFNTPRESVQEVPNGFLAEVDDVVPRGGIDVSFFDDETAGGDLTPIVVETGRNELIGFFVVIIAVFSLVNRIGVGGGILFFAGGTGALLNRRKAVSNQTA